MNRVAQIARKQICDIMSQEMELPASQVDSILFASLGSLRLSSSGNAEMKKVFDHYTFQPEKDIKDLKSYHFVAMNRLFDYPFYIGKKNIVLYSSEDAVAVNLYGGMDEFLEALSSSCKLDTQRK